MSIVSVWQSIFCQFLFEIWDFSLWFLILVFRTPKTNTYSSVACLALPWYRFPKELSFLCQMHVIIAISCGFFSLWNVALERSVISGCMCSILVSMYPKINNYFSLACLIMPWYRSPKSFLLSNPKAWYHSHSIYGLKSSLSSFFGMWIYWKSYRI